MVSDLQAGGRIGVDLMTAEQMFESLGFTEKTTSNNFIVYECVNITTSRVIVFDKVSRRIAAKHVLGDKSITEDISVYELMAIIQQCIELGWFEEETYSIRRKKMNDIKIPSIEFVRLKKGMTESELDDYIAENDDGVYLVYLRYKYDFEEEWDYSIECAAYDYCRNAICWLNDWFEGQQNVEYLAISKLGEEYDS